MGLLDRFRRKRDELDLGAVTPAPSAGTSTSTASTSATTTSVTINGQPATPAQVQDFERTSGFDLDGDGRIAGGEAAPDGGLHGLLDQAFARLDSMPAPEPDRVGQLERLAKLRADGALTDAEFEAEKARILGR